MKKQSFIKRKFKLRSIAITLIVISILMITTGVGYTIVDNHFYFALIGDDLVEVDINKKYLESGAIAKFFGKKIEDVRIDGNVNINKLGKYQVDYIVNLLFLQKELKRTVLVFFSSDSVVSFF